MRLFLSYGHDAHTPLALRLKSDLERRNHEVWFDQARLTPGADWERYIEEGLDWVSAAPGKFLMLLTPHSGRRPHGFCLNELARACARQLPIIPRSRSAAISTLISAIASRPNNTSPAVEAATITGD